MSSVLANISMGFYESKWLNEDNLNKPNLYLRYVGDILVAFDNEQDSLNFLDFLNKTHPDSSLPTFIANETFTNFTQYGLSQEETDLLKAGLYFSIPPDKILQYQYTR